MALVLAKTLPIVEPIPISDTICSGGLVLIQDLGFGARFIVANRQTCYEMGTEELAVVAKLVFPWSTIWPGISRAARFMTEQPTSTAGRLLRIVKG